MNFICNGKNNKGTRCGNKTSKPDGYCRFHIKLPVVSNKNKIILPTPIQNIESPKSNNINNSTNLQNYSSDKDIIQDCPICLCEINKDEEDSGLICKHRFHIDCFNNLQKSECPVCRGPLEFEKSSKVDINKIKNKEKQENLANKERQMIEDSNLSRTIHEEINHNNINHNNNFFINMNNMNNLMLALGEIHQINQAIENGRIVIDHRNNRDNNFIINMNNILTLEQIEELQRLEELEESEELETIEEQQINRAIQNSLMMDNDNKR